MSRSGTQLERVKYATWEPEYLAALTETDPLKLKEKVHDAQAALIARGMDKTNPPDEAEKQALVDAQGAMRSLLMQGERFT